MAVSYNFFLKDVNSKDETPIILYIRYEKNRLRYYTGHKVKPKFWNGKKAKGFPESKKLNLALDEIESTAKKEYLILFSQFGRVPAPIELKRNLDRELKKIPQQVEEENKIPTFLELFERFIEESKNGDRLTSTGKRFDKRSIQKYNTVLKSLQSFSKGYNLTFETIDQSFYKKYVAYLNKAITKKSKTGEEITIKKSYSLNNVGKYIQVIKTFLTYATENGYNTNMFFQSKQFKAHKVPGFSIYLDEYELSQINALDLSKTPHLERVRDLFIVGCWTGLRFSDFTDIKPENITGEFINMNIRLHTSRQILYFDNKCQ